MNPTLAQLAAKFQQARSLHKQGELARAQEAFQEILELQPNHFDALNLSAVIAGQRKDLKRALQLFDKAIGVQPANAATYCNRGLALQELQQLDAALASYNQAIVLNNDYALAYYNRGNVLKELGRLDEALASYNRTIAINSRFSQAYYNRGVLLQELQQWQAALASYDQATALKSDYAEAHLNRGIVLQKLKLPEAALASYNIAIALDADNALAYSNRGNVLKELHQADAALASYNRAIAIEPEYGEAYFNRGLLLADLIRLDEALASFDKAIAIKPDFAEAHYSRALALLLRGDFEAGWLDHEWRWEAKFTSSVKEKRGFPQPLWRGEQSIEGKKILLYGEQGYGDTLQFCRYVKLVADLGAKVILEVQKPLASLLSTLEGSPRLVVKGTALPEFDYQCPLMSLPLAFKTTLDSIPSPVRYLTADPIKVAGWQVKLGEKTAPRIGLVWSGSATQANDRNRSIPLADLVQHLPSEFQYVSLQKEVRETDRMGLEANRGILNFGDDLLDFSDTAALCECVDLVISVDTSLAHLSGALGKLTWILLPFHPGWRWLLARSDSPWYPAARLFRQKRVGDWSAAFEQITTGLLQEFRPY